MRRTALDKRAVSVDQIVDGERDDAQHDVGPVRSLFGQSFFEARLHTSNHATTSKLQFTPTRTPRIRLNRNVLVITNAYSHHPRVMATRWRSTASYFTGTVTSRMPSV